MKKTECLSLVSLALTGVFLGVPNAIALPLLDSDLASFTGLGGSARSRAPVDSPGDANAFSVSLRLAAPARNEAAGLGGNGNPVANSGNSGYPAAWTNPGYQGRGNPWATQGTDDAIVRPGFNGHGEEPEKLSAGPGQDGRVIAKDKDFCSRLIENSVGVMLDQDRFADFCADVSEDDEALGEHADHDLGGNDAVAGALEDATMPVNLPEEVLAPVLTMLTIEEGDLSIQAVPEPATLALLLAGITGLAGMGAGVRGSRRTRVR